ncbi:14378_t:CDS:2, partial [Ambispora leptoticha]
EKVPQRWLQNLRITSNRTSNTNHPLSQKLGILEQFLSIEYSYFNPWVTEKVVKPIFGHGHQTLPNVKRWWTNISEKPAWKKAIAMLKNKSF